MDGVEEVETGGEIVDFVEYDEEEGAERYAGKMSGLLGCSG